MIRSQSEQRLHDGGNFTRRFGSGRICRKWKGRNTAKDKHWQNLNTGDKLSVIFGKIKKYFSDLGSLAFKSTVENGDLSEEIQNRIKKNVIYGYTNTASNEEIKEVTILTDNYKVVDGTILILKSDYANTYEDSNELLLHIGERYFRITIHKEWYTQNFPVGTSALEEGTNIYVFDYDSYTFQVIEQIPFGNNSHCELYKDPNGGVDRFDRPIFILDFHNSARIEINKLYTFQYKTYNDGPNVLSELSSIKIKHYDFIDNVHFASFPTFGESTIENHYTNIKENDQLLFRINDDTGIEILANLSDVYDIPEIKEKADNSVQMLESRETTLNNTLDGDLLVTDCVRNLFRTTATSETSYGVTFTVNDNGTIIANGTATSNNALLIIGTFNVKKDAIYFINGCQSNGGLTKYILQINKNGIWFQTGNDLGEGVFSALKKGDIVTLACVVYKSYTANNLIFKPMIEEVPDGADESEYPHDYVPYEYEIKTQNNDGTKESSITISPETTLPSTGLKTFPGQTNIIAPSMVETLYSKDTKGNNLLKSLSDIKQSSLMPYNYSKDEHIVGTWIDGSPVYERAINMKIFRLNSATDGEFYPVGGFDLIPRDPYYTGVKILDCYVDVFENYHLGKCYRGYFIGTEFYGRSNYEFMKAYVRISADFISAGFYVKEPTYDSDPSMVAYVKYKSSNSEFDDYLITLVARYVKKDFTGLI